MTQEHVPFSYSWQAATHSTVCHKQNVNKKLSNCTDSARCVKWLFKVTEGHLLYQSTWYILWLLISTKK